MLHIPFSPPSHFGLNWQNPDHVRHYQESQNIALQRAFDYMGPLLNNSNYLLVNGKKLEDANSDVIFSGLTAGEVSQLENIGTNEISSSIWGNVAGLDQDVGIGASPSFGGGTFTGEITVVSITIGANTVNTDEWANLDGLNQTVDSGSSPTWNAVTATSFVIGGNTLDTTEWAYLDGQNQAVKTTSNVTHNAITSTTSVTATSFVIGGNALDTTEWAYLDGINQSVATTDNVEFVDCKATTFTIGAVALGSTEWGHLTGLDQPLASTDSPTFNNVTMTTLTVGATVLDATEVGYLNGVNQYLTTTSSVTFNAITATSIVIGANTLDTTEWAYLDGLDQALKSTDSPTFAGLTCTGNITMSGGTYIGLGAMSPYLSFDDQSGKLDIANGDLSMNANDILQVGTMEMQEDGWIGITGPAERLVFDGSGGLIVVTAANLKLDSTNQIQFRDSDLHIASAADGHLDLTADTSIDINGDLDCTAKIKLPTTSSTAGIIEINSVRFFHGYGQNNVFVGPNSGNFTLTTATARWNAGVGEYTLASLTTGLNNMAFGRDALRFTTTGYNNVACGHYALRTNTTGNQNTAIGANSLYSLLGAYDNNLAAGYQAGYSGTTVTNSIFLGYRAGYYETGNHKVYIDSQVRADEADGRAKSLIYGICAAATADQQVTLNSNLYVRENVELMGGQVVDQVTKTASYTATAGDYIILCDTDTAGAAFTITLPAAASHTGRVYYIKNTGTGGYDVTVDGNGAETIDGDATQAVTDGNCLAIVSDGTEWWVI